MNFEDIVEVIPGIYIGSIRAVNLAPKYNIDFIVNLSGSLYTSPIPTLNIQIDDKTIIFDQIEIYFRKFCMAVGSIEKCLKNGEKILVHCQAGVNRCATAIALYMLGIGYTYDKAIHLLTVANSKRDTVVLTNPTFRALIKGFEQSLKFQEYKRDLLGVPGVC